MSGAPPSLPLPSCDSFDSGATLMLLDPRIAELLLRWEQGRINGVEIPAEELCRECPELLDDFVEKLLSVRNTLHTLNPTPSESVDEDAPEPTFAGGLPTIGDYQILSELGQGGMGVVYQAFDRKRCEMVALKTLHRAGASDIYRLKQEFRSLAEVTHPNLAGLYELICANRRWMIAMELIDGVNFLAYLSSSQEATSCDSSDGGEGSSPESRAKYPTTDRAQDSSNGPLSPQKYERLCFTLFQLVQGVLVLHSHGILHRDIKPSNVLVTRKGRVVLLDFGLAAELNHKGVHESTEQHLTGTVAYMSPEQAVGGPLSVASDWYSVGVMLYEALTGRLPFFGPFDQLLDEKKKREPLEPAQIVSEIPEDLNQLCVELLRSSPEARPSGATVLQRLSERILLNSAVAAKSTAARQLRFVGRHEHLSEMSEALEAVRRGRSAFVRIEGRSGAGKSMLAQHFLDSLTHQGDVVVLAGKCYERETVPYKTLDSLVDALSRYLRRLPVLEAQAILPREAQVLAQVFPVLQRVAAITSTHLRPPEIVDPHELRRRAFEALKELLARLGDRKTLVLLIDDLQWGDVDGATQLAALLRPTAAPIVLLLASYRIEDVDTSPCLGILRRAFHKLETIVDQRTVRVDPLGFDEARELALVMLGQRDSAHQIVAETIARESGGNAFFVQELVQCVNARMEVAEGTATGVPVLDEVLWTRIQSLPDEPRQLLEVIAVSGQPLRFADARVAARLSHDEQAALAVLRSGRLIRTVASAESEEVETYHDRIRETILSYLPGDVIRDLHHRIAAAIETTVLSSSEHPVNCSVDTTSVRREMEACGDVKSMESDVSKRYFDLAYHFDAAGEAARAFPYAIAMADQARSQYALEIAEQLYRIAERGAESADSETRYRVAEGLGDVLMLRGRYESAAKALLSARSLATNKFARAQIVGKLGELAFKQGDNKAGIESTEQSLRLLGRRVPVYTASFLVFLIWEVLVQLCHTSFPKLFLARKSVNGIEKQLLAIRLHIHLARAYFFHRGLVPCLWTHLQSLNLAERYPPTLELGHAWASHAPVMSLIPWLNRGEAFGKKSLKIRKELGDVCGQGQSLHYLGVVYFVGAKFDDCINVCNESVTLLDRTGDLWERNMAWWQSINAVYRKGELARAIDQAKVLYEVATEMGDDKVSGFTVDVWSRASGGQIPTDILHREIEKKRNDVQATAQVLLAKAVQQINNGDLDEAIEVLTEAQRGCRQVGMMNAWVSPVLPWLTTAKRIRIDRSVAQTGSQRQERLNDAKITSTTALKVARRFPTDLPHALRECGIISALCGDLRRARSYLDESRVVAERQGANFERAKTLLAQGRVGLANSWVGASEDLIAASDAFGSLGLVSNLETPQDY